MVNVKDKAAEDRDWGCVQTFSERLQTCDVQLCNCIQSAGGNALQ